MSFLEFLYFIIYLCSITSIVTSLLILQPGKRSQEKIEVEETDEKFVETELEEEEFSMTENPMLCHRKSTEEASSPKELKMEKVD